MELGEPDASGRRRPVTKEGSEFIMDVDIVVVALGTTPNPLGPIYHERAWRHQARHRGRR